MECADLSALSSSAICRGRLKKSTASVVKDDGDGSPINKAVTGHRTAPKFLAKGNYAHKNPVASSASVNCSRSATVSANRDIEDRAGARPELLNLLSADEQSRID